MSADFNENNILEILEKVGAIMTNSHFVGTSGKHFDTYINKDALYPHTKETSQVAKLFAKAHKDMQIDVVAAPALGGIILSTWTAHHLSEMMGRDVLSVYAEKKDGGGLVLNRGYDKVVLNKKVLVIEDLATTGGSLKQTIETVVLAGGHVVAAAVVINKNAQITSETFGVPFTALAEFTISIYEPKECPLCASGVPINTSIGHGKRFVEGERK